MADKKFSVSNEELLAGVCEHRDTAQESQKNVTTVASRNSTRTSNYDKFSAFLISSNLLLGCLAAVGFSAWMMQFEWQPASPIKDIVTVTRNEVRADEKKFELPMIDEPTESMQDDSREVDFKKALEAVTNLPSSVIAEVVAYRGQFVDTGPDQSGPDGVPIVGPPDVIPEPQRWRINYEASSRENYYSQLDFFGIELGALSVNSADIALIHDLSADQPARKKTTRKDEKRLYFSHAEKRLKKWDIHVAEKAGVADIDSRIMIQFYDDLTCENLRRVEAEFAENDNRTMEEVSRTYFGIREKSDGFEFYVNRIEYRPRDGVYN